MDHLHYFSGYDDWLKQSDYNELAKTFVTTQKEMFQAQKIISIGCGQGDIDMHIIDTVSPISYTGVEPAKNMISKFQNKYQDRKTRGDLQGVQVQFINQKFEDFIPQEKFELAIMWQCIYYMDMMSAVAKALEVASKLIVVVISPHSEFLKFSFAFPEVEPSIHSNDVFNTFKDTEYEVTHLGPMTNTVRVSPLSDELLEFFAHTKPDTHIRQVVERYISENFRDGVMTDHTEALCITKKLY